MSGAGSTALRIAVKTPVPDHRVRHEWGDWHLAQALARTLRGRGHAARVDIVPEWHGAACLDDDVVIVLRGLVPYAPHARHLNLLWNISHPDAVGDAEYEAYDHVFVASDRHATTLARLRVPVTALLQCTDPQVFHPDPGDDVPREAVLFVGNSRRQRRAVVMDAIAAGLPVAVYGTLWDDLVPASYVKAAHVENDRLRRWYSNATVVLNDHWPAMRDLGFLSNRLFDAGASGALVVSDPVAGLDDVLGDTVVTYASAAELRDVVQFYVAHDAARRAKAAALRALVLAGHTFEHRADALLAVAAARA